MWIKLYFTSTQLVYIVHVSKQTNEIWTLIVSILVGSTTTSESRWSKKTHTLLVLRSVKIKFCSAVTYWDCIIYSSFVAKLRSCRDRCYSINLYVLPFTAGLMPISCPKIGVLVLWTCTCMHCHRYIHHQDRQRPTSCFSCMQDSSYFCQCPKYKSFLLMSRSLGFLPYSKFLDIVLGAAADKWAKRVDDICRAHSQGTACIFFASHMDACFLKIWSIIYGFELYIIGMVLW
jgi:hypothetical protein